MHKQTIKLINRKVITQELHRSVLLPVVVGAKAERRREVVCAYWIPQKQAELITYSH